MNSNGYKIMVLLHVVSIVVAFGPAFAVPMLVRSGKEGAEAAQKLGMYIQLPALVAALVFGFGAVGMSDGGIKASTTWVSIAALLLVLVGAALAAGIVPAQRKIAAATDEASRRSAIATASGMTGAMHLALVVGIILMIWQPGA